MSTQAFGERLRELRTTKGFSLRDLAELVGIDFTYLSKIELGAPGYSPSFWLIRGLARHLEADENELIILSGKIPSGLRDTMKNNPLLTELVRVLAEKPLPSEIYQKLLEIAREAQ